MTVSIDEETYSLASGIYGFVAVVTAGLLVLVLRKIYKPVQVPKGYKLPPVWNTGLPIVGNFLEFAKSPLGTIAKAKKDLGGVFTIKLITEDCTFLIGAEPHAAFFGATDEDLDQADVYQFMTPIFGKGIVYDCPLAKRRQQMRALGGSLKPAMLKQYSEIIARETAEYLRQKWGDSGQIDLLPSMAELIILTASATLLGPEVRGELFLEVSHLYEQLDKGLTPLSIFFPHAPTTAHAKRDKARAEMTKLFSKIIARRRSDIEGSAKNVDILQKLIEFRYKDGTPFTDNEVTGMLVATLFAGQHTSSITTTWTLLFLLEDLRNNGGKHYSEVVEELASLEPRPGAFANGEELNFSVVNKEEKMYAAVKEAVRLHPPLILLMRRVVNGLKMADGTYIPKGHRVLVSNAVAQRLPEIFPEPDTFNPSRWSTFDQSKLPKYSFIGFGAGIHTCMGESFAFMQVRTILSVILSKYEMQLTTPFPEANYEALVVPPKGPNMVSFKLRKEALSSNKKSSGPAATPQADYSLLETDNAKVYTMEEVAKHNNKHDLWIVVKGLVYDVTNYVDVHQGGENALVNWAGKDATEPVAGPQHPSTVPTLLERYCIGKVKV